MSITEVDLSNYVRVARYDLPLPNSSDTSLLASEASAVTYNWDTDTLFVVGDGGTSIVQVTKTGQLIDSMTLASGDSPQGTNFYDTEGLTYVGNGQFVMTEERDRQVVLFTYAAGTTLTRADASTVDLGTYRQHRHRRRHLRSADRRLHSRQGEDAGGDLPDRHRFRCRHRDQRLGDDRELDQPVRSGAGWHLRLRRRLRAVAIAVARRAADSSHLLVLSQEAGKIVNVDRAGNVLSTLNITGDPDNPLTVPDMTMEGVAMDKDGFLYVVNENGGGQRDWQRSAALGLRAVERGEPGAHRARAEQPGQRDRGEHQHRDADQSGQRRDHR